MAGLSTLSTRATLPHYLSCLPESTTQKIPVSKKPSENTCIHIDLTADCSDDENHKPIVWNIMHSQKSKRKKSLAKKSKTPIEIPKSMSDVEPDTEMPTASPLSSQQQTTSSSSSKNLLTTSQLYLSNSSTKSKPSPSSSKSSSLPLARKSSVKKSDAMEISEEDQGVTSKNTQPDTADVRIIFFFMKL